MNTDEINNFVEQNWTHYKEWLVEYVQYIGDWDTDETRYQYWKECQ